MSSRPGSGVLSVNKPSGPTSREIVDWVVGVLGTRRVGHAGTLDPMASGLLLVAWEKATGLVPYLQEYPKTYRARVRFGRVTDTQDRTGNVLEEHSVAELRRDRVLAGLSRFRGVIKQVPPMFSALKQDGKRLYTMARRGEDVERVPRDCRVDRLELLDWDPPFAELEVVCSKGTYVRTLAHDLGRELGSGACLEDLVRTAVGPYTVNEALSAEEIPGLSREELLHHAHDPARALPDWPSITVTGDEARAVTHGSWRDPEGRAAVEETFRVLDGGGRLLALARGGRKVRLLRVFAEVGSS